MVAKTNALHESSRASLRTVLMLGVALFPWVPASAQHFIDVSAGLPSVVRGADNSMDIAVGDIDADQDPDIIIAVEFRKNVILLNDGKGNFLDGSHLLPDPKQTGTSSFAYHPHHDSEDIALADFDQDGDLDLVFVSEDDQANEYYLNSGKGVFLDHSESFPVTGISNAIVAADFDGDGFTDLIIGNNGQNFYLRNSKGKFVDETATRLPKNSHITQDLVVDDLDEDGDPDVLVGNEQENQVLLNDGMGFFTDATTRYFPASVQESGETRKIAVGDVNTDGEEDLYFANVFMFQQMQPIQRLLIHSNSGFTDEAQERLGFSNSYSVIDANFADLEADGDQDLLLVTTQGPLLYSNNGKGYFEDITTSTLGRFQVMGVDAAIHDFNGDQKPDIYLGTFRSGDKLFLQD